MAVSAKSAADTVAAERKKLAKAEAARDEAQASLAVVSAEAAARKKAAAAAEAKLESLRRTCDAAQEGMAKARKEQKQEADAAAKAKAEAASVAKKLAQAEANVRKERTKRCVCLFVCVCCAKVGRPRVLTSPTWVILRVHRVHSRVGGQIGVTDAKNMPFMNCFSSGFVFFQKTN